MIQYHLDLENQKFSKTKDYGDLKIGRIYSSFEYLGLVFFGGRDSRLRVLDLSKKKLIQGHLSTAIEYILSLQVCVVGKSRVYLVVVGKEPDYSSSKSDLYDLQLLTKNRSLSAFEDPRSSAFNLLEQVSNQKIEIENLKKRLSQTNQKVEGTF